jgi:hypothetical protein
LTNITSELEQYINFQNVGLWNKLKTKYTFEFLHDQSEYSWKAKVDGDTAIIVTPNKIINYSSFTHELLHIYLDNLGLSKCHELVLNIQGIHSYLVLSENDLVFYIYNFCSHKKMFPYFKEMGFSEYEFVQERISLNSEQILKIETNYKQKHSRLSAVNQIIGQTLSLLNNVVEEDNTKVSENLTSLKTINQELFMIIEKFDSNWTKSIDLNLTEIFLNFENELENWLVENA